jgi:hypothetical protein
MTKIIVTKKEFLDWYFSDEDDKRIFATNAILELYTQGFVKETAQSLLDRCGYIPGSISENSDDENEYDPKDVKLICDDSENEINDAKETLRKAGYFVDNLWHVDDVKSKYQVFDNEDAQDILNDALTNEWVFDQIWYAIRNAAELNEFKELEENDED